MSVNQVTCRVFFSSVFTIKWKKCTRLHGITQLRHKVQIHLIPLYNLTLVYYLFFLFFFLLFQQIWVHDPFWLRHIHSSPPSLDSYRRPSLTWLTPFHHAITAKSFIKKIKLTSRQSRTHVSTHFMSAVVPQQLPPPPPAIPSFLYRNQK